MYWRMSSWPPIGYAESHTFCRDKGWSRVDERALCLSASCWSTCNSHFFPHTLIVPSLSLLTRNCPSGLNETNKTAVSGSVWIVRSSCPVSRFHSLMVLSLLPLARVCLSGLIATL